MTHSSSSSSRGSPSATIKRNICDPGEQIFKLLRDKKPDTFQQVLMEAILNCKPEDLEDYYGLLGCDELSSTEQILNEYKIKALACHPDKHLDNPSAVADFQKLQEAKEVLCNETKRKNYDHWRRSGVTIPFHDWQALNDSVKTSMHWAVRNKKEPMLEASNAEMPVTSQAEDLQSEQEASRISSYDAMSSAGDYCHRRFRWAADSPSSLLQKFRNYEI